MKFIDKYNAAVGAAITLLTALFGVYWYVFAGYLLCNILDYITGWAKARKTHKESSGIGIVGIVKKVGYWIIILVAFMIPELFIHLGQDLLGVNLSFLALLAYDRQKDNHAYSHNHNYDTIWSGKDVHPAVLPKSQ